MKGKKAKIRYDEVEELKTDIIDGRELIFFTYDYDVFYQWERYQATVLVKQMPHWWGDVKQTLLYPTAPGKEYQIRTHDIKRFILRHMRSIKKGWQTDLERRLE